MGFCRISENESVSCSVMSDSLQPHGLWPATLLCPRDFPGKNTGVRCHSFPDPGIELCLALQADSLLSKPPEKPFVRLQNWDLPFHRVSTQCE